MSSNKINTSQIDVAIIGGGAAGLSAAISAAKISKIKNMHSRIEIFEAKNKIGSSILKTGNGRCNFSNYFIDENKGNLYNNAEFCNIVFDTTQDTVNRYQVFDADAQLSPAMQMFENLGLACYVDEEGKMFPYTNKASSVLDVLRYEIQDLKVKVSVNKKLIDVKKDDKTKKYLLYFETGKKVSCKKIIFSIGSEKLCNKIFAESVIPFEKVLGPIKTDTKFLKNLDGTKAHAKVSIINSKNMVLTSEIGEVLFRKYGLSGICVFNLSRFVGEGKQKIEIDFAPEDSFEDLYKLLSHRFKQLSKNSKGKITAERLFAGMILPNIVVNICAYAKVDRHNITLEDLKILGKAIKGFNLQVLGLGDERQCQVCRGGIKTSAIDPKSMAYKFDSKIYFAGEVVDVDGPCGGYNLHWAWTSGILAGASSIIN